jgi:hypothetical protein
MNQDFSSVELIDKEINKYLSRINADIIESDLNFPDLTFYKQFKAKYFDLTITILQVKEMNYKIDIGSSVGLSQEHMDIYNKLPNQERIRLKSNLFMWLTPRNPQFIINIDLPEKQEFEFQPGFVVYLSIYEGDLTFQKFMENIDLVIKSAHLARKIIQDHLNGPMINNDKEVEK